MNHIKNSIYMNKESDITFLGYVKAIFIILCIIIAIAFPVIWIIELFK